MRRRRGSGFTLVEVLVALAILEVGLIGAAGTLLSARRALSAAERLHAATQAAAAVADSLLADPAGGAGARDEPWGRLRWARTGGGIEVRADDRAAAPILAWWIPVPGGPP